MKKLMFLALLSVWLALPVMAQETTTGSYTITIAPSPLVLTPASGALAAGTVNVAYKASIAISGGTAPYSASVTTGTLPAGVSIAVSGSTLNFSGTPTTFAVSTFVITVTDSSTVAQMKKVGVEMQVAKVVRKPKLSSTPPYGTQWCDNTMTTLCAQ